jgi:hypothetical protein
LASAFQCLQLSYEPPETVSGAFAWLLRVAVAESK